jgi:hypothetical protein
MITLVPHQYAGRQLAVNDEYEAGDEDVRALTVMGLAQVAAAQEYQTRVMEAAPRSSKRRVMKEVN